MSVTAFYAGVASATTWEASPSPLSSGLSPRNDYPPAVARFSETVVSAFSARTGPTSDYDIYVARSSATGAYGTWDPPCIVEDTTGTSVEPDVTFQFEPGVPANTWVVVVWADDTGRPAGYYDVRMTRTRLADWPIGGCPTIWAVPQVVGHTEVDQYPHVAASGGYAHVAFTGDSPEGYRIWYSRWDGVTAPTVPIQLSTAVSGRVDIAAGTVPFENLVNVVWECQTPPGVWEIVAARSVTTGTTWVSTPDCSSPISGDIEGLDSDSIMPSVDMFESQVHVAWTEQKFIDWDLVRQVWYTRSLDGGATWEASRMVSPLDGWFYFGASVASCGFCVGLTYVQETTAPPSKVYHNVYFLGSGDAGITWGTPVALTTGGSSSWPSAAADRRVHVSQDDFQGGFQVVYVSQPGVGDATVFHRRAASPERAYVSDGNVASRWGTSAGYDGTGPFARIVGGWVPAGGSWNPTAQILTLDTTTGLTSVVGGGLPSARAETSAAWSNSPANGFFIFGGRSNYIPNMFTKYGATDEIVRYVDPFHIGVMGTRLPSARFGTAAVSDQSEYAYVFGGMNNDGVFLGEIVRYDMLFDTTCTYALTLSPPRAYASAVWDPATQKAYLFGGSTATGGTIEILQFDPGPGVCVNGVVQGGSLTPWALLFAPGDEVASGFWCPQPYVALRWGTSAVWNPAASVAYVFGGAACPAIMGETFFWDSILVFHPGASPAEATVVTTCIPLPSGRAYTAAVWSVPLQKAYVFPGKGTVPDSLNQVVGYVPDS